MREPPAARANTKTMSSGLTLPLSAAFSSTRPPTLAPSGAPAPAGLASAVAAGAGAAAPAASGRAGRPARWRLAPLPQTLAADEVDRLLDAFPADLPSRLSA